jgi:hypothetical protein
MKPRSERIALAASTLLAVAATSTPRDLPCGFAAN